MQVLGELIVRPTLDEKEIDQERGIIIEEIRSYLDDPSEYCQILFQGAMFGDGPLGREIYGDEAPMIHQQERTATSSVDVLAVNVVVASPGDLGHDEAVALADTAFGSGKACPKVGAGAGAAGGHGSG